jgi:sterol 3beta-glucosyltransferase
MQYGIVAIGSRGDVQPYVALALGLMDRGHETTILAHENFKDFVEGYGIHFVAVKGHVEDMLRSPEGMAVVRDGSLSAFTRYLQKVNKITSDSLIHDTMGAFEKADVIVASLLAMPWVDAIAEKLGKGWAIVQLNLPTIRTKAFPLVFLDFFNFPGYNRFSYRLFEWVYWRVNKKNINQFRGSLGLPGLKISILKKIADEKILNLHCFSTSLLARPNDWAPQNQITGFLFIPNDKRNNILNDESVNNIEDNIPADMVHWLNAGDKPIYIGFGSIPVPEPKLLESILTELLRTTNHRFTFCQGWSSPLGLPNHPNLFQIKSVDHQWLFPHCKAAVIHGGVGTTAAALRAKIPVIIVSIIADQPWWGKIIERKKLGVHIPFKTLTFQKLSSAIENTHDPEMQQNVIEMGEKINREHGLKKTIDSLEKEFKFN